ncbi:integrin alpha-8-like [Plakobranchus ocellatus]|uniref:Integrin alpha-8-like n=1 Tax=Plakobranchus ocellatus TaxID=259542 RepID=A0AAV4B565_9GAST|nr:integrin alpha-8-like [Plakobranchus ocellatus]
MALSRLGDINYDGFDDLCVGAPYAGEDRQGAVYFFHGSSQGIITDPTQVIYAKDVASPLSAFGISVSGGWDQDSNDYPDLLVGAYASDKAVFFRTRPVIKMAASIVVEPSPIDLKLKKCGPLNGDPEGPCLGITICYGYSGLSLPNILHFDTTLTLDSKDNSTIVGPAEQRAFFTDKVTKVFTKEATVDVTKDQQCNKIKAYVKGDLVDKLTPIKVVLEFKLNEEKFSASGGGDLLPILDARIPTWTLYTVEIKNDCGDDNICYPNLAISGIRTKRTHVIGTTAYLDFVIIVNNFKEDAYNTKAWITLPPGVVYDTISNQRSTVPISCGKLESDSRMVVCDIGNPMKGGTRAEFTMIVTPTNTNDTQDRLVFILFANSSNTEEKVEDYSDNHNSVEFPVTAVAEISLQAKVNPEFIVLNTTREKKVREERLVTHVFQLRNQGTCAINETILQVLWPSNDEKGNDLLYLTGPPLVQGNGKCNITVINPQNAKLFKDRWWIHDSRDRNRNDGLKSKKGRTSGKRIDCSETGDFCTVIQCHIGYMKRNSVFEITMESGFRPLRFLRDRISTDMYKITSVASARVLSVPYDFKAVDTSKFVTVTENAVTVVHTDKLKPAGKGVKIWVIALAITAGVLLLILLILLLWFCGFFRRKKHEEARYLMVKNGQSSYIDSKIVD